MERWKQYQQLLQPLEESERIQLPFIPKECAHNAHMFYIKTKDLEERTSLIEYLKFNEILAVFHYIPLHNAPAGKKYGTFFGNDRYTTKESERILRLPMFYGLTEANVEFICEKIIEFYRRRK